MRLAQIGTVIASIGGALLGFGDLGGQVASGAAQFTLLKYGRDDETEADRSASNSRHVPGSIRAPA